MKGRFPSNGKLQSTSYDNSPNRDLYKNGAEITAETHVVWYAVAEPLVELRLNASNKQSFFWMTANEAKALGQRLMEEADKIIIQQAEERFRAPFDGSKRIARIE